MTNKSLLTLLFLFSTVLLSAQDDNTSNSAGQQGNYIPTAVPFLTIAPDSRSGAMGNAGVATTPDVNSQHWNSSKYALGNETAGASMSYTPWLKQLVDDINLYYVSGFYRLDKVQTISASLRYFSMGSLDFSDEQGNYTGSANPNEFAFDVAYSRLLGKSFAGGVALRYIRSDLYSGTGEESVHPGNAFAADVNFSYLSKIKVGGLKSVVSAGVNFSNIGSKISYDDVEKEFLPANMRLGGSYLVNVDEFNSISLALDFNKLMVPTPDTSKTNSNPDYYNDMSVPKSIFSSFADAPGGMKEELQEITISIGAEYWYNKVFAARAGYFHENEYKGNRKYFTAGAGLKFNMFQIDASYIIPVEQNNPLANTIRFTLAFDLSQYNKK